MTVANRIRQTLSSLIGIQASLQTFAIQSPDPKARQAYEQSADEALTIITQLKQRLQEIEKEEPQYKT